METKFIRIAKKTVINIYNTKYGPVKYLEDDTNSENNDLFNHIFEK